MKPITEAFHSDLKSLESLQNFLKIQSHAEKWEGMLLVDKEPEHDEKLLNKREWESGIKENQQSLKGTHKDLLHNSE